MSIIGDGRVYIGKPGEDWAEVGTIMEPLQLLDIDHIEGDDVAMFPTRWMSQSAALRFQDVDLEAIKAMFGDHVTHGRTAVMPMQSMTVEKLDYVSAEPRRPARQPGFWAWLFRHNQHADRLWVIKRRAWVRAGCPDMPSYVRWYFPNVRIDAVTRED